jgi:hypothetical protein
MTPQLSPDPTLPGFWIGWSVTGQELGSLLLLAGDETGYQALCQSRVDVKVPENDSVLSCVSRTCTMMPGAVNDFSVPLGMAALAVQQSPRTAWHLYALGIAQHRACQQDEAIQTLKRSLAVNETWVGRGQNYATLALACHSLGRDQEARQWLHQTRSWLNESNRNAASWKFGFAASDFLCDWLCAQVLLREAERLLADGQRP